MKALIHTILYQPLYNVFILLVLLMPNHNIGLAIIALTILVRLALMPLKFKSLESQMKMKELQPELKRIQDKHKDNKQAQSLATMQLYKDSGSNPASGCIPTLIQFPILIVLFYVIRAGFGPEQYHDLYSFINPPTSIDVSFLWLADITKTDSTFILPILAGISQFFFSRTLMKTTPTTGNADDITNIMTKQMMYFMPIMTVLIARNFPAALSLYWVIGTLADWLLQHRGTKRYENRTVERVTVSVRNKKREETR